MEKVRLSSMITNACRRKRQRQMIKRSGPRSNILNSKARTKMTIRRQVTKTEREKKKHHYSYHLTIRCKNLKNQSSIYPQ